jgi:hypothetical protein
MYSEAPPSVETLFEKLMLPSQMETLLVTDAVCTNAAMSLRTV